MRLYGCRVRSTIRGVFTFHRQGSIPTLAARICAGRCNNSGMEPEDWKAIVGTCSIPVVLRMIFVDFRPAAAASGRARCRNYGGTEASRLASAGRRLQ